MLGNIYIYSINFNKLSSGGSFLIDFNFLLIYISSFFSYLYYLERLNFRIGKNNQTQE